MDILILLGAVVGFIIDIVIANVFANIAEQKGAQSNTYFWLCFFLGCVGWIAVAALPDRGRQINNPQPTVAPSRIVNSGKIPRTGNVCYGKCEICGKDNTKVEEILTYDDKGCETPEFVCSDCLAQLEK